MCRIHGYFAADTTPHEMRAAAAVQRHGGPDAHHRAHGRGWALAANRLAIVDAPHGAQPFRLGDQIQVVFNGEIYNHEELRARLRARGHRFTGASDGNVLPALYAEYGPAFTDHLDGMYAVAVVDLRAEPTLLLVTDPAGMKPLYYHWDGARLHFASELPSLLAFRSVPVRPWPPGLEVYLSTKTPLGTQTMFEGIRVLAPGAALTVTGRGGLTLRRPRPPAAPPILIGGSLAESGRRIRALLGREVARMARADVPVCAITSGGLDSGLVTALLAREIPDPHMFHLSYRGRWPQDESGYAREVARMWRGRLRRVEVDPASFPDVLGDVVWHLGQPNADPITVSTYLLFQAVRAAGFPVALSGDGADEVFGGYDRLRDAVTAGGRWREGYADALAAVPARSRRGLYTADYLEILDARPAEGPAVAGGPRLRALSAVEVGQRLPAYHLRRVDHLSMAHAVEVRMPYCQPSVVAAGLALTPAHRIGGGGVKRALYAAAAGELPAAVLRRRKQPFTLPVTAMLAEGQPLLEMVADLLSPDRLRAGGQLAPKAVAKLLRAQRDRPSEGGALALWSLAVHELWREQFFPPRVRAEAA